MNICAASAVLDLIPVSLFAEYADFTILCQCSNLRGICGCCLTDTKAVRLNNSGDTAHIAVMCFCLFPKYQIFILYVAFYAIRRNLTPLVSFLRYRNCVTRHQTSDGEHAPQDARHITFFECHTYLLNNYYVFVTSCYKPILPVLHLFVN